MPNQASSAQRCENKRVANWCNHQDVKLVQLRTQAAGGKGTNLYDGDCLWMCAECRKANTGGFKLVKPK